MSSQKHTEIVTSCESVQVYLADTKAIVVPMKNNGVKLEAYLEMTDEVWEFKWLDKDWTYKKVVNNTEQFCKLRSLKAVAVPAIDATKLNNIVWIYWDTNNEEWRQL